MASKFKIYLKKKNEIFFFQNKKEKNNSNTIKKHAHTQTKNS